MKIIRAIAAVAFFAAISAASVTAQPKPTTASTPALTGSATGNVPETKLALVDTDQFLDEKAGIVRLVTAAKKVENEFLPRRTELQGLQTQIDKLKADLQRTSAVQDPKVSAQQQEAIDQKTREMQRKSEDADALWKKKMQDVMGPIYDDIGKALDVYAKAHGITLILDV